MSGGDKKYGRNKKDAQRYQIEGRLEKNKRRKLAKHIKRMGLPASYLQCYTTPGGNAHAAPRQQQVDRVIFGGAGRQIRAPFYEVHAAGHSVQWTDRRQDAHAAFADTDALPKTLSMVNEFGRRTLIECVDILGNSNKSLAEAA